jgi:hypothetical protein
MTNQQFWKGLALLIVSLVLSVLGTGIPDYAYLFLAGISAIFGYVGKNILFVTATTALAKILSGLLVAIGAGITESIGLLAIDHKIMWLPLVKVIGGVLGTYLITTFLAPPAVQSKQIKKIML